MTDERQEQQEQAPTFAEIVAAYPREEWEAEQRLNLQISSIFFQINRAAFRRRFIRRYRRTDWGW